MNKRKIFCIAFIYMLCLSCNNIEDKIQGCWTIEEISYKDQPYLYNFYANSFILNKDHTCELPFTDFSYRGTKKEKGKWGIIKNDGVFYININTENEVFNSTFEIKNFSKEIDKVSSGNLLIMTLISKDTQIKCKKALYN